MSELDQISAKAASVAGEARVASRHIEQIADAAGQLQSRQDLATRAIQQVERDERASALDTLRSLVQHCPDGNVLQQWCRESQQMVEQVQRANAELQEAVEKAKAQQEAALID